MTDGVREPSGRPRRVRTGSHRGRVRPDRPTGTTRPAARRWSAAVLDLLFVAITLAVFGTLALIVRALEKL